MGGSSLPHRNDQPATTTVENKTLFCYSLKAEILVREGHVFSKRASSDAQI